MIETLLQKLAVILVAFPGTLYGPGVTPPETQAQREDRIEMATEQLGDALEASAFPESQWPALLTIGATIWIQESALDYDVHAGNVSPIGDQDGGRARCLSQIQTWPGNTLLTKEQWQTLAGTTPAATRRCADAMYSYLWYHATRCLRVGKKDRWKEPLRDDEVIRLFAAYGEGHCAPVQASNRLRLATYRKIRAQLSRPIPAASPTTLQVSVGARK